jgi:hypothetical protein
MAEIRSRGRNFGNASTPRRFGQRRRPQRALAYVAA